MISIAVHDAGVLAYLHALRTRLDDLGPAMRAIGMEMESRVSTRFTTESDPSGQPWADWEPSTIASYPSDGNARLLDRYGDGLDSLSHRADSHSATIGFGAPYMVYHEYGTVHMERRGLLTDDPEAGTLAAGDQAAVLAILVRYCGV